MGSFLERPLFLFFLCTLQLVGRTICVEVLYFKTFVQQHFEAALNQQWSYHRFFIVYPSIGGPNHMRRSVILQDIRAAAFLSRAESTVIISPIFLCVPFNWWAEPFASKFYTSRHSCSSILKPRWINSDQYHREAIFTSVTIHSNNNGFIV
jgi:hypothetical protein